MMASTTRSAPGASIRKLTPNGLAVSSWIWAMAASTSFGGMVAVARNPMAPALQVAATSSGWATHPIPVWMIG